MKEFPVVVADDDAAMLRLLEARLAKAGFKVFTCADGDEALTLVYRHKPAILLADWGMPGLTGLELCRTIHKSELGDDVYAILITGNSHPEEIAAGLDVGANDYLVKPVDPAVLLARVRAGERILQLWMRQREHARSLEAEIAKRKRAEFVATARAAELEQRTIELDKSRRVAMGIMEDAEQARNVAEATQAELRKAHAETGQLFEAISSVLIGIDPSDRINVWNSAAEHTLGIERGDALGRAWDDLDVGWDRASLQQGIANCRAQQARVPLADMRFNRPDGSEGFIGVGVNPLESGSDGDGGVLLIAADITEQLVLQTQLAQAQKLESIGQLAAGIAHEINTPTQYVGDNTRFLQDSVPDLIKIVDRYAGLLDRDQAPQSWDERAAEIKAALDELDIEFLKEEIPKAIEQSLEGLDRVATIVRSMKEFSHPSGKEKQSADLNAAIESTITVARNEWKYVAEMVTDFDSSLPHVPCLVGEFNQVILNMVINAAHAITDVVGKESGDKGTITVSTRHDGDWAEIRVRDTGTGIPEEIRSKIFDPFFTTKDVGKGTGQGLAIARTTVVKELDGELRVESEVGQGTTFVIRLPINPKSTEATETPKREAANSLC